MTQTEKLKKTKESCLRYGLAYDEDNMLTNVYIYDRLDKQGKIDLANFILEDYVPSGDGEFEVLPDDFID